METKVYDIVVIGAGQAGLAMGYELQKAGLDFIILDGGSMIGESWQNRYDSLRLFTTARYNGLAGMAFPGPKDRFPAKQEVVDYLQSYAVHFNLPIKLHQHVQEVGGHPHKPGLYLITTTQSKFIARQIVVCTGAFHKPYILAFAQSINPGVQQLHSSRYKHISQLKGGKTVVVGGGNSGVQLAEELVLAGQEVYFSYRGKLKPQANSALHMRLLFELGIVHAGKDSWLGRILYRQPEHILGTNLKKLFRQPNLIPAGAATGARHGFLVCDNKALADISNIIWATGYTSDFKWIKIPVFDKAGKPAHKRGVTARAGLYFLGLPWLHSRSSGLLGGVSRDAAYLSAKILKTDKAIKLRLAKDEANVR